MVGVGTGAYERLTGTRAWRYARRCVSIDSRTLAVFRVFVSLLILADLGLRSRNFTFFYTEHGVVPRSLAMELSADYAFSFYHVSTDSRVIAALFVIQALIALQLLVGYKTRTATILSFLFVVSLDHHNPLVLSYADTLFRLLMFWAIFLPLGERWSLDAIHRDRTPRVAVSSVATALILLQMVFMYVSNGLIKTQSSQWPDGTAAPKVLGLDEMTFLLGDFVRQFPTLLEYGGLLWFYMLLLGWLLLVLPGRARLPLVGLFVGGHLSFALTVRIGAFAYVALAGLVLFVQTPVWTDLARLTTWRGVDDAYARIRSRVIDLGSQVPTLGLESPRLERARGTLYTLAIAVVVATILFVSVVVLSAIVPVALDGGGDEQVAVALDRTIDETMAERQSLQRIETVARSFGIAQPLGWSVFAPEPRTDDRYYVFPAQTVEGEAIDVYNNRPLTYDRPYDELQKQHGTYRERFYMNSIRRGGYHTNAAPILAAHICENAEAIHGTEITHLAMYMVSEKVTEETIDDPANRERTYTEIYTHGCGDYPIGPLERPET